MSTKPLECKFLDHGIALAYQTTIKPCCVWQFDSTFQQTHNINFVDLKSWHQHKDIVDAKNLLASGTWPKNCTNCQEIEEQGRQDSMRLNGINAYGHYTNDDITLEIRPGSVCNFACQTCWPAASSRVYNYHRMAGILPDTESLNKLELLSSKDVVRSQGIENFDFLLPVAKKLKNIVLLGGEPFYDPNSLKFIQWWKDNTNSDLLVFTNGLEVDFDLLTNTPNKITLVFSLDAVGTAAEYIRFGTKWEQVFKNYQHARQLSNIDVRVNITTSAYNFYYFPELLELLAKDWPQVVTFGNSCEPHITEAVIPDSHRPTIISKLTSIIEILDQANIEYYQKCNAVNAVKSIIDNLQNVKFDQDCYNEFKSFVQAMDRVKGIRIRDYCPFTAELLGI